MTPPHSASSLPLLCTRDESAHSPPETEAWELASHGEGEGEGEGCGWRLTQHFLVLLWVHQEEEEEEEEKDEAALLILLLLSFYGPLYLAVTCSIWFFLEEFNSALLGSTVDTCS